MSATMSSADPSPLFAALGDPTRLSLVIALSTGDGRSIASLTARGGMTRQAVAKHLRVLERAGLVRAERVGRESQFSLRGERLADAGAFLDTISRQWDEALGRLTAHVERG